MTHDADLKPARFQGRLRDLCRLLKDLLRLHEDLMAAGQRKLQAMRRCDAETIHDCVRREADLTAEIRDCENLRRKLMTLIGEDLGLAAVEAQAMSVSQLAIRLDEKKSLKLRAVARQLGDVLAEIARVNRVVTLFARQMLEHYRFVFNEITKEATANPVYVRDGRAPAEVVAQVFDATG